MPHVPHRPTRRKPQPHRRRAYGTTVSAILAANPLIDDPDLIFPGQALQLPNGTGPSADTYTVRSGDSMRKIAAHFDLTLGELIAANPHIGDANMIRPGGRLRLPGTARPSNHVTPMPRNGLAPWLAIAKREMDTRTNFEHSPRYAG